MNIEYTKTIFLLLSLFVYVSNETLGEKTAKDIALGNIAPKISTLTLENDGLSTRLENGDDIICTNPEEITTAAEVMDEAVTLLRHHAANKDDYSLYHSEKNANLYFTKPGNPEAGKLSIIIQDPNKYDDIVTLLSHPNGAKYFDESFISGKISRLYNANFALLQQRYRGRIGSLKKYFYALMKKVNVTSKETIIAYVPTDINDNSNPNNKNYNNTVLKKANSLKININSEEDIRNGKLKKTFSNVFGYIIKKEIDHINITYVKFVEGSYSILPKWLNKMFRGLKILKLTKLINLFSNKYMYITNDNI
ncbi:fam-a protein [Plasmodium chabaudi chabaudi]|uniref:Fam-a protein n=1 Tax=Plasmodium chabaudi chabaudi TaxID=31271 RepID=A0A4V0K1S3_PLACU|nr:fam-a protein [Plasmodium chabaudi chabaudi]VTZ66775.1 fam-a protein [Plasmodium chabaudi chabaudi]